MGVILPPPAPPVRGGRCGAHACRSCAAVGAAVGDLECLELKSRKNIGFSLTTVRPAADAATADAGVATTGGPTTRTVGDLDLDVRKMESAAIRVSVSLGAAFVVTPKVGMVGATPTVNLGVSFFL